MINVGVITGRLTAAPELNADNISLCGNKGTGAPKADISADDDYTDIPDDEYGFPWTERGD